MTYYYAEYLLFDAPDESQTHYAEWKKLDTQVDMLYHSTYMKL